MGIAGYIAYNDGTNANTGTNDYALIADFDSTQDIIQLRGVISDYTLVEQGGSTFIYIDNTGTNADEVVAIVNGVTGLSLSASYFQFVGTAIAGNTGGSITGTNGDDILNGTAGDDTIDGLAGNDQIYGEAGNDTLNGGADSDQVEGGAGNDQLFGGAGGDSLYGQDGTDTLNGDAGNDDLYGGLGGDTLNGGDGNDRLFNNRGYYSSDSDNNTLNGGAGDDYIRVESSGGNNTVDGGTDTDTLSLEYQDRTTGVTLNVSSNYTITAPGTLSASNVERLEFYGTSSNDSVLGGGANNDYMEGRGGDDTLEGGAGDDNLNGGEGGDTLNGGDGNDRLFTNNYYFSSDNANNTLNGGAGDDYIRVVSSGGNNTVDGGTGADVLVLAYGERTTGVTLNVSNNYTITAPGTLSASNVEVLGFYGTSSNDVSFHGVFEHREGQQSKILIA